MFHEAVLKDIVENPITHTPIVLLKEKSGKRILSIDIGLFEANIIANYQEGVLSPRPMTHDLIFSILDSSDLEVDSVFIEKEFKNTFYANIKLSGKEKSTEIKIDSRPSDAITLALKNSKPIFVHDTLFNRCYKNNLDNIAAISPFFL